MNASKPRKLTAIELAKQEGAKEERRKIVRSLRNRAAMFARSRRDEPNIAITCTAIFEVAHDLDHDVHEN